MGQMNPFSSIQYTSQNNYVRYSDGKVGLSGQGIKDLKKTTELGFSLVGKGAGDKLDKTDIQTLMPGIDPNLVDVVGELGMPEFGALLAQTDLEQDGVVSAQNINDGINANMGSEEGRSKLKQVIGMAPQLGQAFAQIPPDQGYGSA